ncbi:MAG: mandelate racemase/muconate lactonizing enzyme family protein [Chloroflexi bacterium]|nr:mandelate racemase/muconate lactonizing enzyme family protein [Chloroflexota bacterium]
MKITNVTVDKLSCPLDRAIWDGRGALSPGEGGRINRARGMALVRIQTDEGIVGLGDAALCGAPPAVVAGAIELYLKPLVVGEDPFYVERIWQKIYRYMGGSGRRGFLVAALSGIDIALWDIVGKALGAPLYKVLGAYRDRVPAYASGGFYSEGKTVEELADETGAAVAAGFRAVKMKIGGLPLSADVARVKAVRFAVGDDCQVIVDANNMYAPKEAIQIARAIQDFDITWFEEPVKTDDVEGSAQVAAAIDIPVAGYETEFTRYGFRDLIARRAVDIVQPDVIWSGGITECRRIAALAAAHDLPCIPHAFTSAMAMVSNLHLLASLPNGGMLEFDRNPNPLRDELFLQPLAIDGEGCVPLPQKPGLGVDLNEETVARYRV